MEEREREGKRMRIEKEGGGEWKGGITTGKEKEGNKRTSKQSNQRWHKNSFKPGSPLIKQVQRTSPKTHSPDSLSLLGAEAAAAARERKRDRERETVVGRISWLSSSSCSRGKGPNTHTQEREMREKGGKA